MVRVPLGALDGPVGGAGPQLGASGGGVGLRAGEGPCLHRPGQPVSLCSL